VSAVHVVSLLPHGIAARLIDVQASISGTDGGLTVAGPDGALQYEMRDRVRAGIVNSGLSFPRRRVTVTITPPGLWQPHSGADLAVAAAILIACAEMPAAPLHDAVVIGEVGLDGAVGPVAETLRVVATAAELGHRTVVVPAGNARAAMLVPGVQVIAVATVRELVDWAITGEQRPLPPAGDSSAAGGADGVPDLVQLPAAMTAARFALEVAAAGGHHLIVTAPPRAPSLLVGQCLASLLPDLDEQAAVQVSALHEAAGRTVAELIRRPPLQQPHHTSSIATVIGGRRPGAVCLAHRGVLLLADAPEFDPRILRSLRQPLDLGIIQLAGARGVVTYPASFQLVLTARICPCPTAHPGSACPAGKRRAYRNRLGAVGDRIDIALPLDDAAPAGATAGESSATVAARVTAARAVAVNRWAADGCQCNADIPITRLQHRPFRLPPPVVASVTRLLDTGVIGIRGHGRIIRLAWTVSDLRGMDRPDRDAVTVAADLHLGRRGHRTTDGGRDLPGPNR
jgi:magnesium chelatase family protein